jgi:hypothetical protein
MMGKTAYGTPTLSQGSWIKETIQQFEFHRPGKSQIKHGLKHAATFFPDVSNPEKSAQ